MIPQIKETRVDLIFSPLHSAGVKLTVACDICDITETAKKSFWLCLIKFSGCLIKILFKFVRLDVLGLYV